MTRYDIQTHTFGPHKQAVSTIAAALQRLDSELYAIARRKDLGDGDRHRMQADARAKAEQAIRNGRAELGAAIQADRQSSTYADVPDGEAVARRSYYAQQASAELAGRRGDEQLAVCQQVAATGNQERLAEYVRFATPAVQAAGFTVDLGPLQRQAMSSDERQHRAFRTAVESMEANLAWLDSHVATLTAQAGNYSKEQVEGWEPSAPLSTSILGMWSDRMQSEALGAAARHRAALDGQPAPSWAQPRQRPEVNQAAGALGAPAGSEAPSGDAVSGSVGGEQA